MQILVGKLAGFAVTFFVPIVLVRHFAPADFGTYKQLFLIYATLYGLAQGGMAESLFYFLPRDAGRSGRYAANSFLMLALWGGTTAALLFLSRDAIGAMLHNPDVAAHLPALALYLALMVCSAGLEIALTCSQRYAAAATSYALSDALRALVLVAPILLGGGIGALMLGALAFAAGRLALLLLVVRRTLPGPSRPDGALLRRQLAYGLPFQLAVLVEVAQANLHQYAVAWTFDAATFALYSVGCLQMPLAEMAASSAGNVLMVGLGQAQSRGDVAGAREIWNATTIKLATLLLPLVTVLLLVSGDLIPLLFTDVYRASVPIFVLWTLATLLSVVQTDAALRAHAQIRVLLLVNLARIGAVALLIAPAIAAAGILGAALANMAAFVLAKLLALGRVASLFGVPIRAVLPWRQLRPIALCCAVAALPALLLSAHLHQGGARSGSAALAGSVLAVSAAFAAALAPLYLGSGVLAAGAAVTPLPDSPVAR